MGIKPLLAIIVLILISALGGFAVGQAAKTAPSIPNVVKPEAPKAETIFSTQTATVQGKIAQVSGSSVTVTNTKGQSANFTLSPKVVIYKPAAGSSQSTATQDPKAIETNKNVLVKLELTGSQYQVTEITYIAAPPPPPAR